MSGLPGATTAAVRERALAAGINFRYVGETAVGIALDETSTPTDVSNIAGRVRIGGRRVSARLDASGARGSRSQTYPAPLRRTSAYLTHPGLQQRITPRPR